MSFDRRKITLWSTTELARRIVSLNHNRLVLVLDNVGQPLETFVETVTAGGASGLDVLIKLSGHVPDAMMRGNDVYTYPLARPQAVEAKLVCDFGSVHGVLKHIVSSNIAEIVDSRACVLGEATYRKILLVGKDQEGSLAELILVQHALKLLTSLNNTVTVIAVDNEDDTLGVLEVVPPQRTDLVLTTDIPHGERDVLVLDRLDVETCIPEQSASKPCK